MKQLILFILIAWITACSQLNVRPKSPSPSFEKQLPQHEITTNLNTIDKVVDVSVEIDGKGNRVFVKEYLYNSSEDDSKNSSRQKAIKQLKILLTEEIGVYIESYLEINTKQAGNLELTAIQQEIKSFSAGISKVKVLNEQWDGKTYYMKASVVINEQKTLNLLLESIKQKADKEDVDRLNRVLAEQEKMSEVKEELSEVTLDSESDDIVIEEQSE